MMMELWNSVEVAFSRGGLSVVVLKIFWFVFCCIIICGCVFFYLVSLVLEIVVCYRQICFSFGNCLIVFSFVLVIVVLYRLSICK